MAPRCRHGFRLDHAGSPTARGPIRPLPIAWIMIKNVSTWHSFPVAAWPTKAVRYWGWTCRGRAGRINPVGRNSLGRGKMTRWPPWC